MNKKLFILSFLLFMILLVAGCSDKSMTSGKSSGTKATVFKSPLCGCCVGYSAYLEQQEFDIEIVSTTDMDAIKQRYNIPENMESCHTTVVGNYFVEGHVPIEAVDRLLQEKPQINGIALPNMPAGTPGMPGVKRGTWTIYGLKDGQTEEFTKI